MSLPCVIISVIMKTNKETWPHVDLWSRGQFHHNNFSHSIQSFQSIQSLKLPKSNWNPKPRTFNQSFLLAINIHLTFSVWLGLAGYFSLRHAFFLVDVTAHVADVHSFWSIQDAVAWDVAVRYPFMLQQGKHQQCHIIVLNLIDIIIQHPFFIMSLSHDPRLQMSE